MNIRIRSQYFTEERDKDSTVMVALSEATRLEVTDAAECIDLVCLALRDTDGDMREVFISELRRLALAVSEPARQARKEAREPLISIPHDDEGDAA